MVKQLLTLTAVVLAAYLLLLHVRVETSSFPTPQAPDLAKGAEDPLHKVYRFSFSMYQTGGEKELEIEGDSANIFTRNIDLSNVIARAYAEESPVTVTADGGVFDKSSGVVHLKRNVVAATQSGARLLTESLDIDPDQRVLETEEPAQVRKDNIDVQGLGARSDSSIKKVHFKKNVTVEIADENRVKPSTIITCDGPLEINYVTHVARFERNVVARDAQGTLTSDHMDVFYDQVSKRVSKMIATGNVVVVSPQGNKTYSDSVVYLPDEGRVILGGDSETTYFPEREGSSGDMDVLFSPTPASQKRA